MKNHSHLPQHGQTPKELAALVDTLMTTHRLTGHVHADKEHNAVTVDIYRDRVIPCPHSELENIARQINSMSFWDLIRSLF